MDSKFTSPSFLGFFEFLIEKVTPEAILAYQVSEVEQRRAGELLNKNYAGKLSSEEETELERLLQINQLEYLLKGMSAAKLANSKSSADTPKEG